MESKPENVLIKDYLIKKIFSEQEEDSKISEKIMHKVISHQFEVLREKMHNCNSVEISGFGKFYFAHKKATRHQQDLNNILDIYGTQLQNPDMDSEKRELIQKRVLYITEDLRKLKLKLDKL